jgi:hypothetical protein
MAIRGALGDLNEAQEWLHRAGEERSFNLIYLLVDARLTSLHALPQFRWTAQKIGLHETT